MKWGKNTELSLKNFNIGTEKMPEELIYSILQMKKACAQANYKLSVLDKHISSAITNAVDELLMENFMEYFPLSLWQTGSGTQTNMNVNEVIANKSKENIHPNDHVNKGQSTNDVFPSSMQVMSVLMIKNKLLPNIDYLIKIFKNLSDKYGAIIKTGRTHYQDATPLTFGQEISAWIAMLEKTKDSIIESLNLLKYLPIGGTAVGTGLNTVEGFDELVCGVLTQELKFKFEPLENKSMGMSSVNAMVEAHHGLSLLASNLMKIGDDLRFLASGPRTGIGEINLPSNEPGSSIMPGKVNPTQIEALTMVSLQVMSNHQTILTANSQGHLQLNVYLPLVAYNFWQSTRLLSDSIKSFSDKCVSGITINKDKMQENIETTLMTATILTKKLGYDHVTKLVQKAHEESKSIKEVILELDVLGEKELEELMNYQEMLGPRSRAETLVLKRERK